MAKMKDVSAFQKAVDSMPDKSASPKEWADWFKKNMKG